MRWFLEAQPRGELPEIDWSRLRQGEVGPVTFSGDPAPAPPAAWHDLQANVSAQLGQRGKLP